MTKRVMMGCGHAANGHLPNGHPCCVICVGIHSAATTVVEDPALVGREAMCPDCNRTVPSSLDLAFFEYMGPGSEYSKRCRFCGCTARAHRRPKRDKPQHVCDNFEARGYGREYDSYYCGCRGWD